MVVSSSRTSGTYLQKIRRFIRQHEMLLGKERVLVAVSGGIDSMTLLDMIHRISSTLQLDLAVAHFDHGLRQEASQQDATFVVEQAKLRGLKSYVGRGDVKKLATQQKLSIEEASRKARYQFLTRVAKKHDYSIVLVGHNANDNAETLLMNLLRGTGVSGLAAIPPVRTLAPHVLLARPLLGSTRADIEGYAREVELEWREDATNASLQHTRNRVRHELLPLIGEYNPGIVETLNSTAQIMRGLEQYLSHAVDIAIKKVVMVKDEEHVEINVNLLKHYLPAIQSEIVQRTVSKHFDLPPISYGAIERTLGLLWKETGSKAELTGGLNVVRDRDTLTVRIDPPVVIPIEKEFQPGEVVKTERCVLTSERMQRSNVRFTRNANVEFIDADKISPSLTLRTWREGDRFRPLGMGGEKKVSDFLVDVKVALDRKRDVLVVADGENIIWVCGMRLDDRYRVDQETKNVVKLEIRPPARNGV